MRRTITALSLVSALVLALVSTMAAAPALAQDAGGLSMGTPVAPDGGQIGTPYAKEEHGAWTVRCVRTETGRDPCQLYQLLKDANGDGVAEIVVFPLLPPQGDAVAGGNVMTPLETLLTQQLTLSIDGGEARRYPFMYCNQAGCMVRMGFAVADLDKLRGGTTANVAIVPMVAPDQRVELAISLDGFTAGYAAVSEIMDALVQQSASGN